MAKANDGPIYGVVDVGGTKIVAGVASATEIFDTTKIPTDVIKGADAVTASIATAIREVQRKLNLQDRELAGVGVSVPGPLDTKLGIVSFSPNLHWVDYPVGERLCAELGGVPVAIDDDAAEQRPGGGRGQIPRQRRREQAGLDDDRVRDQEPEQRELDAQQATPLRGAQVRDQQQPDQGDHPQNRGAKPLKGVRCGPERPRRSFRVATPRNQQNNRSNCPEYTGNHFRLSVCK